MLSFVSGWAQHTGMHEWSTQRPEPGSEIVLLAMCQIADIKSWKSVEAFRGFYTTWTKNGELVSGSALGLQSDDLPSEVRTAFLEAQANHKTPVVLVNPQIEYTGQILGGVIDADALNGAWWIGCDELAKSPVPLNSLFDLERPKTRAAIRYKNRVYPMNKIDEVVIAKQA